VKGSLLELGLFGDATRSSRPAGEERRRRRDRDRLAGQGRDGHVGPRLDASGKSVRGQLVARFLPEQLGMDLLISRPAG
jgi:hypothetical protein